ncbi:PEP-CTERM sorting domain-containing protein [Oscillatoriales cyanobacterium LEGE 11467]|uniref:PEP-CTERM sorting domain-containing protein n=1 Tax=Zarconia navalis LEGE 11467 TaxID=1828826 RepID=A0A928VS12_9CYAN|nr:PEP-CTERM sorting domain-containing protein [Zarconia navalis]MBE9039207.1 PEP-CTERM sorting domain-containing protein [Zarconia navalis LEGE 11467]
MKTKHLLQLTSAAAALTAAVGMAGAAQAASLFQDFTIDEQQTNFSDSFDIEKFDTSLGNLLEVNITLEGTVGGTVVAENTSDSSPANLDIELTGTFDLMAGGLNAAELISLASDSVFLDVGDGNFDGNFDDPNDLSTITLPGLSGTDSVTNSFASGAFFDQFLGSAGDTLLGEFDAKGDFDGSDDNGNTISGARQTVASGLVTVEYVFEPTATPVPEPGTAIGVGLAAAAGWFMKKKKGENA